MLIFSLDTKKCMNALLLHPAFDSFYLLKEISQLLIPFNLTDD